MLRIAVERRCSRPFAATAGLMMHGPGAWAVASVRLVSSANLDAKYRRDTRVVDMPPELSECVKVYRNVISETQEQRLWEELEPLIEKAGQKSYAPGQGTSREDATVRNVSVDLYGFDDYKEVRDHQRQEVRRVPGLVWSDTLMELANTVGKDFLGEVPDTVRLLEHHMPGYEMHVEAPPFGAAYLCLHLFAPGLMAFDNEAQGQRGQVLLPERSVVHVSGEARWGWRVGESFELDGQYRKTGEAVEPEFRIALWFFKFNPSLADNRSFADGMAESLTDAAKTRESEIMEADVVVLPPGATYGTEAESLTAQRERERAEAVRREQIQKERDEEEAFAREALDGSGLLGGDLDPQEVKNSGRQFKRPSASQANGETFGEYKKDLARMGKIVEKVKVNAEAGKGNDEDWMRAELSRAMGASKTRAAPGESEDAMGFDENNPSKAWDDISNRAEHYRQKLKSMDFNASPTADSDGKGTKKGGKANTTEKMPTSPLGALEEMQRQRDDIIGETTVEPFDPREAARVLDQNRRALRAKHGMQ